MFYKQGLKPSLVAVSSNFDVLSVSNTDNQSFQLQLKKNGASYKLTGNMTLNDVVRKLKQSGQIQESADFFAPDGSRYARSSTLNQILADPYFIMKADKAGV